jgi:2-(1,2-epoxy-1,2-dihydrophenyl)acetyl-CoA isomerase
MNDANETDVLFQINGPVATITLDRPDRHNAMSVGMLHQLRVILESIAASRDIRIVVLTGTGDRFFCPGADLQPGSAAGAAPVPWQLRAAVLLHDMPQLTIAAINGAVAGAGLGWACACDLRVANASAMFNVAFLAVGVAGDMGLPWTLSHIVGAARARELFFLREKFDAGEALRWGLVAAVYEPAEFRREVDQLVDRLANAAPTALLTMKANFLAAERTSFSDFFDLEIERHLRLVAGPEFRDGVQAFREGRART